MYFKSECGNGTLVQEKGDFECKKKWKEIGTQNENNWNRKGKRNHSCNRSRKDLEIRK